MVSKMFLIGVLWKYIHIYVQTSLYYDLNSGDTGTTEMTLTYDTEGFLELNCTELWFKLDSSGITLPFFICGVLRKDTCYQMACHAPENPFTDDETLKATVKIAILIVIRLGTWIPYSMLAV